MKVTPAATSSATIVLYDPKRFFCYLASLPHMRLHLNLGVAVRPSNNRGGAVRTA